jgi:GxxExxY protein
VLPSLAAETMRQLGPGHREAVYRGAMGHLLHLRGYRVLQEHVIPIRMQDGFCVGYAYADLMVEAAGQEAVIELKVAAAASVGAAALAQTQKYRDQSSASEAFLVVFSSTNRSYNVRQL